MLKYVPLLFMFTACGSLNEYMGLEDDNIAEEVVEIVIEAKTGLDVDLTPGSKEERMSQ